MGKICSKCGYERQPSDNAAPDYECPMCGAVYKAEERKQQIEAAPPETSLQRTDYSQQKAQSQQTDDSQEKGEEARTHRYGFRKPGCILNIPSLSFLLPETLELETSPENLPPASILQRILAGVTTFLYMVFIAAIMRYFAVLMGIQYLRQTGAFSGIRFFGQGSFFTLNPETADVLNIYSSVGVLLGAVIALLIMPLLWRGLSFGQRAMRIIVIPKSKRFRGILSGSALMLLRMTFRTRTVSAEKLSRWSWTKILYPVAAIIVLNYAVFLPVTGILRMGDFFGDKPESTREELHFTQEMQHNMMVNELQRRSDGGDEAAAEALEGVRGSSPGRDSTRIEDMEEYEAEVARWEEWAEKTRNFANMLDYGQSMVVPALDGGSVEITPENVFNVVETARPHYGY